MKTLPTKLLLLFSLLLVIFSCEKDEIEQDIEQENLNFKIVSKFEAQRDFNSYQNKRDSILSKSSIPKNTFLEIQPDWSSFYHEDLNFEGALLSVLDIKTNADTNLESKLTFININGKVIKVIKSKRIIEYKHGKLHTGFIFFHNLEGEFILGYEMENGILIKKFFNPDQSKRNTSSEAFNISKSDCDEDLDPNTEFCNQSLSAVVITVNNTLSEETMIIDLYDYDRQFGINPHQYDGYQSGGGGTSNPEPEPETPCPGDPLANMKILGSSNNGIPGGQYGNGRGVFHDGTDFAAPLGTPVYAARSGVVANAPYQANWKYGGNDAGNRVYINSDDNLGNTLQLGYWHLVDVNVSPGQIVTRGQFIGYTGVTGNVLDRGSAGPHLHNRARFNRQKANPEDFLSANFDEQGNNTNDCN